ncbi:hypothetical protein FE782_28255 [Paenibacillus antri]|uniref:Regulatory protein YycH-like domain-containing protein n=1 Tax=Paenibacillus antri TaxID=2582848 RepID=A0A5R9FXY1_9BACL|nr:two-component system regulatory protein YycI [Paenibacillus antri]TLS48897.1 hypothetical protein FE782_28255 [Paenibacillus antri]
MDWSRAKTVLIWAFLLLNVLLGYQLWMDELNLTTFAENATRRDEMNRLLEQKDVRLATAIPEGTPSLREITVRLQSGERSEEPTPLSAPFPRSRLNDASLVRESLAVDVPNLDAYEPDPYASKPGDMRYVMHQLHGGLPMFEMRLELYGEGDTIDRYRVIYSEVETPSPLEAPPPQGQEVLSAYVVVGSLAENYLPRGAVVADVRLGYHGPIFESETQVLAPYWRIVLNTGETYYVHAVNGAVEGPSAETVRAAR